MLGVLGPDDGADHTAGQHPADGNRVVGGVGHAEQNTEAVVLAVGNADTNEDGAAAQQRHGRRLARSEAEEAA